MDQSFLVDLGRKIVKALEAAKVPLIAALWVREVSDTGGEDWRLWLAPKTFTGRSSFYMEVAKALAAVRPQTGFFDISNIRVVDPKGDIVRDLRHQFPKVSTAHPRYLFNQSLGGTFLTEGIVLRLA